MISPIWVLFISHGLVFALCATAVRIQHTLFRGFDFICALSVLLSAELFVWLGGQWYSPAPVRFLVVLFVSIAAAGVLMIVWNRLLSRLFPRREELGSGLLVLSLGVSTAGIGIVTLLRGPGLRGSAFSSAEFLNWGADPAFFILVMGGFTLAIVILTLRTSLGLGLNLWAQDRVFATEIGLTRAELSAGGGALGGACLGLVGSYFAVAGGSTPEIGLPAFLYGAASALLFPGSTVGRSIIGGLVLGPAFAAMQFVVSPAFSNSILFALALVLLVVRGTSRSTQKVR